MEKKIHMKTLWSILSGSTQPASLDLVGPFIESCKDRIISGVLSFDNRGLEAASAQSTNDFAGILSSVVNLSQQQTADLLDNYKENEFRGTAEQFENLLKNKHFFPGLLTELSQFYHSERVYLLHCIEFLIKQEADSTHPYTNIFKGFLETFNSQDELKKSLVDQLKALASASPPSPAGLVTQSHVKLWSSSNLRERILVLQCLLHYTKEHSFTVAEFVDIAATCLKGLSFPSADPELESLVFSILHLQSSLLVTLFKIKHSQSVDSFKLKQTAVEEELQRISSRPEFSPVLLAWMLMQDPSAMTPSSRQFGEKAINQRVLKVVTDICTDPVIEGESPLKELVCCSMSDVVSELVSRFDTDRLGSDVEVRSAVAALLHSQKVTHTDFFRPPFDQGVRHVWNDSLVQFPTEMIGLLELAKAVAETSDENKLKMVEELNELPHFSEQLDNIPQSTWKWSSEGVVVLLRSRCPYESLGLKDVVIPRGTLGSVEEDTKTVRWHTNVSLFDVAVCDMQILLQQASLGLSAIKVDTLQRVQKLLAFFQVVFSQLELVRGRRIQSLILALIERFASSGAATAASELLAACFSCLAASLNPDNAAQLASQLHSAGVLPVFQRQQPTGSASYDPSTAVSAGLVGNVLAGVECPQGNYPLTIAWLKLVTAFVQVNLFDAKVIVPSVLFILQEILPFFVSWQYISVETRDSMIDACLEWLHRTLQCGNANPLRQICVRSLLESARSEADWLVTIASCGSAQAEMQLLKQTNWDDARGKGLTVLRQIRLSLSILNLLLQPENKSTTGNGRLEQTLLSSQRFVSVLAHYIFYRFDLRLATLALKVLRSCATRWTNVSLLACLGQDAQLIRNTWLNSLESTLEDAGLCRSIVHLMTDAVAGQPGLMHMLVNGDDRCLKAVARLLDSNEMEALKLVRQFWFQRCSPAVEFFKKRTSFWSQLCRPLLESGDKSRETDRAALIFQIAAIELYNTGGRVHAELLAVLNQIPQHLTAWSQLALGNATRLTEPLDKQLLSGWSDFIVMLAHYGPAPKEATKIRHDVLDALIQRIQQDGTGGEKGLKQLCKLAELFWMLQTVEKEDATAKSCDDMGRLLNAVAERELISFPARFQAAVLTSAVTIARRSSGTNLSSWMRPTAICVQSCLVQLPGLLEQEPSRASCISALCLSLLRQLLLGDEKVKVDLTAVRETYLAQSLISTVRFCIHSGRGWDVAEVAMTVLLALADSAEGSGILSALELDKSLWLPMEAVYGFGPKGQHLYRLGVQLCTLMLTRQRHFFLDETLTLVGVHQPAFMDVLLKLRFQPLGPEDVVLAVDVVALLRQLSVFQQTWRLQHALSMQSVLQASTSAVYYGIAHLMRPKLLLPTPHLPSQQPQTEGTAGVQQLTPSAIELQSQLLELVSQGLALLNCYSPPLAALLTEDGIDVAKWERHLSPSFGSPSLDHATEEQQTPVLSFGTLNAVASHCLRILSKPDSIQQQQRSRFALVLEQALSLLLSQALLYILDPRISSQEKQLLKRELGSELGSFVESIRRQAQRGLRSPLTRQTSLSSSSTAPPAGPPSAVVGDQSFLKLVGHVVQRIFK